MRILLVEDEARMAQAIKRGLRNAAYAVDVARDGEDALYQTSINDYDAVILEVGDLEIDTRGQRVSRSGRPIELTTKEYTLLEYLARNAGKVVGREEISEHVWDDTFDPFSKLIEVYINRLRRKVDEPFSMPLIHTRRGAGYELRVPPDQDGAAGASDVIEGEDV